MPEQARLKKLFVPVLLFTVVADIWFMTVICRFERDPSRTARCSCRAAQRWKPCTGS